MTTHHPENQGKTHDIPSPDNVAKPDTEFQFDPTTGLSTQRSAEIAKKRRFGHAPIIGLLGLGLAAGGVFGVKALSGGETHTEPRVEPSVSAPAVPGGQTEETPTTSPEAGNTAEPTPLSVERYEDGDALVRAWNAEHNEWLMANATPETQKKYDATVTLVDYVEKVNEPSNEAYSKALFVDDWEERPQLADFVNENVRIHNATTLLNILSTNSTVPEDLEPYKQGEDITSTNIISQSPEKIVVHYEYVHWDNSDKNATNQRVTKPVNGATGQRTITWTNSNGIWKISDAK